MVTILAIDDSATMRTCIEIAFEGTDLDLVLCDSSLLALDKVAALRPGLVLVDASLPPTDGYDLCDAIKGAQPAVAIVLLTSKQSPFDAARGGSIDDHVEKPFDCQALYEKVKAVLVRGAKLPEARSEVALAVSPMKTMNFGEPALTKAPFERTVGPAPAEFAVAGPDDDALGLDITQLDGFEVDELDVAALDVAALDATPLEEPLPLPPLPNVAPQSELPEPSVRSRGVTASWELPPELARMRAGNPDSPLPSAVPNALAPSLSEMPPSEESTPSIAGHPRVTTSTWDVPPAVVAQVPMAVPVVAPVAVLAHEAWLGERLGGLGLTESQVAAVITLSREVIERVAWEVVPTLAETIIKEELRRLTET